MKTQLFIFLATAAMLSTHPLACGQQLNTPKPGASLSMTVTPVASGGATRSKSGAGSNVGEPSRIAKKENYTQERVRKSQTTLAVEVRNLGRGSDPATVEWIFLAGSVNGGDPFILNRNSRQVALPPGQTEKFEISSSEVASKTTRKLDISTTSSSTTTLQTSTASATRSGNVLKGWLVRLKAGDRVVAVRASSPSLESIARDDAALGALKER
jgi:hypothetical protein